MRASLKAVLSGKQVAVLAPTTILASQHYAVFGERFADYPVKIEMLSRFRSGKEQAEIVAGIRDGKIDIVIGTHRLIQKDIVFSDLGLVVIDEEHRFGVRHKEKLKHIRKTVDVLTMTATPIPRTLSMALGGVRDISIIDTPPPERLPIDTYMGEYDEKTVKMAVSNELKRGGQVFYVHNRVETILTVAARLETLLAGARIGVAHGQLSSSQLEKIMEKFINREYDVLVVTTIIESGLDIPNVNTMIITDAHKMGLAQLYQLRGRIGRDRYKAYCYVLYPRGEVLSDIAKRRLGTIFEHSELGAGFRIALEDLQLRGAGNILGAEQHGHMLYVGFDLYCKLLERAVDELRSGRKAETVEQDRGIEINLPAKAYIPLDYVESAAQRIAIYKRLASTRNREDIDGIEEELADCYGRPPEPCRVLFHVVEMRQLARRLDMSEISAVGSDVHLQFRGDTRNLVKKFSGLRDMGDCEIKVEGNEGLRVIIRNVPAETAGDIGKIRYFLQRLL